MPETDPASASIDQVVHCQECGRPWGAVLRRGVEPSPDLQRLAQEMMVALWIEGAEDEEGVDLTFDVARLPAVAPTEVIYISDAVASFVGDRFGTSVLGGCWQELAYVDMPGFLFKGRKRRSAYRWDCCTLGAATPRIRQQTSDGTAATRRPMVLCPSPGSMSEGEVGPSTSREAMLALDDSVDAYVGRLRSLVGPGPAFARRDADIMVKMRRAAARRGQASHLVEGS